jgi:hypothetical protein
MLAGELGRLGAMAPPHGRVRCHGGPVLLRRGCSSGGVRGPGPLDRDSATEIRTCNNSLGPSLCVVGLRFDGLRWIWV